MPGNHLQPAQPNGRYSPRCTVYLETWHRSKGTADLCWVLLGSWTCIYQKQINRVYDFTRTIPLCCVLVFENNGGKESRCGSQVNCFFLFMYIFL